MRDELREKLIGLLKDLVRERGWQPGEVEGAANYILTKGGRRAARKLVKSAGQGRPAVRHLLGWIYAWYWEKQGMARTRMERVYLRTWEWGEVKNAVNLLLSHQVAHCKAAALGYLALIGARVLQKEGLEQGVSWLLNAEDP